MEFGNLALGEGDEADAGEFEPLEQTGDVFLVAREAVEGFGDDDVEGGLARAFEQRLITRAQRRGAAERGITIDLHQFPALADEAFLAKTQLVLDGRLALVIGGIAGVDDGAEGHGRGSKRCGWKRWAGPGAAVKNFSPGSGGIAEGSIGIALQFGAAFCRSPAGELAGQRLQRCRRPRPAVNRRAAGCGIAMAGALGVGRLGTGWAGWRHWSRYRVWVATL